MITDKKLLEYEKGEEFDYLFHLVTGIPVDEAKVREDGFLFIPTDSYLRIMPDHLRARLSRLADGQWENHIVNDEYAGWWIKRP